MTFQSHKNSALYDYDLDLDLMEIEQAARWIQQSGGRIALQGDIIRFKDNACHEAKGVARSDVLERNRAILGDGWSEMQGELRCEAGDLVIPLDPQMPSARNSAPSCACDPDCRAGLKRGSPDLSRANSTMFSRSPASAAMGMNMFTPMRLRPGEIRYDPYPDLRSGQHPARRL